jgi:hypothetical protein
MSRIERGIRILENKLNIPPQRLQLAVRKGINALAVKGNAAFLRSTSRSSARPVVDLPQPDSPPAPAFRPARDRKLTFSTACTSRFTRFSTRCAAENA